MLRKWGISLNKKVRWIFWGIVIACAVTTVVSQQITINKKKAEVDRLDASIEAMNERKAELETQENTYMSDEFIEDVARERLGYVRSDEVVFRETE